MATLMWTKSKEQLPAAAARRHPKAVVDIRCRKHPKHRQSPGVCSACLREKLCQLPATSTSSTSSFSKAGLDSTNSSSLSSYYSSSSTSSCSSSRASPLPRRRRVQGGGGGRAVLMSTLSEVLRKSRSMAAVAPATTQRDGGEGRKKKGFWSILRRQRKEKRPTRLDHSITMRDVFLITTT